MTPAPGLGVRAIVVADGDGSDRAALDASWPGWDSGVELVVAADGGARLADQLGLRIDRWVGDGDSLGQADLEALRARGVPVELVNTDKDESDTELAVIAAAAGATDVTILGALGGRRIDHALANVALLAHEALAGRSARLLDGAARVTLLSGPRPDGFSAQARFEGRAGDLVSLLPLSDVVLGVTTEGLEYALRDESLPVGRARGLSNVRVGRVATVAVREGRLLVIETPATLPG